MSFEVERKHCHKSTDQVLWAQVIPPLSFSQSLKNKLRKVKLEVGAVAQQ